MCEAAAELIFNRALLFASVRERLFTLPNETTVFPAHDYKGFTRTSIGMEKEHNPRLGVGILREEFDDIMASLNLAYPKKIQQAVPANMMCGLASNPDFLEAVNVDGVPTVTPDELHAKLAHVKIIDVRKPVEFNGGLGHIPNAQLSTLGPELDSRLEYEDRKSNLVFVCHSGKRSAEATKMAINKGLTNVYNLQGGMVLWHDLNLPAERDLGGS